MPRSRCWTCLVSLRVQRTEKEEDVRYQLIVIRALSNSSKQMGKEGEGGGEGGGVGGEGGFVEHSR